ncbi:MAG: hypothetical protein WBX25_24525 [Rhodomicrobium sp.]
MERLPYNPQTFRDIVEADLRRAARLIIKVQDELDPQVRFGTPEGDFHIAVTLPSSDTYGRRAVLRAFALFMAWKQALAFTFASELYEPDCVFCAGLTPKDRFACVARIRREPRPWTAANFGEVEWLPQSSIDPALVELLPTSVREMSRTDLTTLEKWFGARGKFPAVHIPTGKIGVA